jgi:hypothetical protein
MKCTAVLLAFAAASAAAPPIDRMKKQAFLIVVEFTASGKSGGGTGSGFPIDPTHVVTNFHVCCNAPAGAKTDIAVAVSEKETIKVVNSYAFQGKDLAILELEKPVSVAPVTLATRQYLQEGQDVWAVGFPGASLRVGDLASAFVPSISKGIISKFMSAPSKVKDAPPVKRIQMTAAVNSGNSGGPLFDECGRVSGVVVAKALTSLGENQTFAEGINLSIQIDELVPELDKLKIRYTAAQEVCTPAGGSESRLSLVQVATLLTAAAALFLALNKRTRTAITQKLTHHTPPPRPVPAGPPKRMMLHGVSGTFAGQKIPLSAKPCVLGRDATVSNLVFPNNAEHVSKRHCQITCDSAGRILLEDSWSSNGTFTAAGLRLTSGQARELRPGDRFHVGSHDNTFEVIAE